MTIAKTRRKPASDPDSDAADLELRLETPLPASLAPGCRTSLFILGSCFHRDLAIRRLDVMVGGVSTRATAASMPRLDVYRSLHPTLGVGQAAIGDPASEDDPNLRSYRSGFWATVPVEMPAAGGLPLVLTATLET